MEEVMDIRSAHNDTLILQPQDLGERLLMFSYDHVVTNVKNVLLYSG